MLKYATLVVNKTLVFHVLLINYSEGLNEF